MFAIFNEKAVSGNTYSSQKSPSERLASKINQQCGQMTWPELVERNIEVSSKPMQCVMLSV